MLPMEVRLGEGEVPVASAGDRFALLTDAAIDVLAELGMRGLTHRAVDARAGLSPGSTSAYFRTRKALIEAVVRRLADLDRADIESAPVPADVLAGGPDAATPATLGPAELDRIADGIAALLDQWLTVGRNRALARYACLLEATHHPQLRQILSYGATSRAQARALLTAAGARDAEQRGYHFVAFVDGLLFDRLIGAGALSAPVPGTVESRVDLAVAVRLLLRAMSDPLVPPAR